MASKKRHRSDNALASATANLVCVPLLPRLEELVAHAAREHSCWSRLLDEVVRAVRQGSLDRPGGCVSTVRSAAWNTFGRIRPR